MKLITLTELLVKGDGFIERPMLINPEAISTVGEGNLESDTIPIIGAMDGNRQIRRLVTRNNQRHTVTESLKQIQDLVHSL